MTTGSSRKFLPEKEMSIFFSKKPLELKIRAQPAKTSIKVTQWGFLYKQTWFCWS